MRRTAHSASHAPSHPLRVISSTSRRSAAVLDTPEYTRFKNGLRAIDSFDRAKNLLEWDDQLHVGKKGAEARARQMAALASHVHALTVAPELAMLARAVGEQNASVGDPVAARTTDLFLFDVSRASPLSPRLVEELEMASIQCRQIWQSDARPQGNFAVVVSPLERVLALTREKMATIDGTRKPYDVALQHFERELTSDQIAAAFDQLRTGLTPLIDRSRGRNPQVETLGKEWSPAQMHQFLSEHVLTPMGFDFEGGRADWSTTAHPCCTTMAIGDVRLLTRYETATGFALPYKYAVHEAGHGLYEQGRPLEWEGLPVSNAASMSVHESQSLLWEKRVGHSLPMLTYLGRKLSETLARGRDASAITQQLFNAMHRVEPGFTRIHADEVTYPFHIMIRFELERAMLNGDLEIRDLAAAFRAKAAEYLGIKIENDREGALQDTHWYAGYLGYFPTYTLGAIYGAQIFTAAGKAMPDLDADIEAGNLLPLRQWLRENVHRHGSFLPAPDLMRQVTGVDLDPQALIDVLGREYDPARLS